MNSQRIKRQKLNNSLDNSVGNTKQNLFTPCRRMGLNRKKNKNFKTSTKDKEIEENTVNNVEEKNNETVVEIESSTPNTNNNNEGNNQSFQNLSPIMQDTSSLDDSVDLPEKKKTLTVPVSINISRCNLENLNLIQPEQKLESNRNEVTKETHSKVPSEMDDSNESDFYMSTKRKKKKILTNKQRNTPKPGTSQQKEINVSNTSNRLTYDSDSDDDFISKRRRQKNSKENQVVVKEKDNNKNKLKKFITPIVDQFNRTDHIRIGENKSITIIHKDNVVSYVKSFDNDVNFKVTESDDNQQQQQQQQQQEQQQIPSRSYVQQGKSMILERKDYITGNKKEDGLVSSSSPSIFEDVLEKIKDQEKPTVITVNTEPTIKEIKKTCEQTEKENEISIKELKDQMIQLESRVKKKQERVDCLKRMSVYKESHNVDHLKELTLRYKQIAQETLLDMVYTLRRKPEFAETSIQMSTMLGYLKISSDFIGYDENEDKFT